jgi:hypothetical protein
MFNFSLRTRAIFCLFVSLLFVVSSSNRSTLFAEDKKPASADSVKWNSLFDGKTLGRWEAAKKIDFEKGGKVHVKDRNIVIETGSPATGVRLRGKFPKTNYELALDAKRVEGSDFFCGLTFPVDDGSLTLILGGWGGWVVGLSCIDNQYAIDNETCQGVEFKNKQWYRVRVRVTKPKVEVWLDDNQIIELATEDRKLEVSLEMEPCLPVGIATWKTTGAIRNIRYRTLSETKAAVNKVK